MIRIFLLTLVTILVYSRAHASPLTTCTYNSLTVKLPSAINFSTGTESGQIISKTWHETITPIALDCQGHAQENNSETIESIIKSTAVDSGKKIAIEGNNYIIYKTNDPKIGVISEVADGATYAPLTTDFQVLFSRTITASNKATFGSRIRTRLVALDYLPPGTHFFTGATRLTWHGFRPKGEFSYSGASTGAVSSSTINVKNEACTLQLPSTVILPRVDASHFSGTTSNVSSADFNMTTSCTGIDFKYAINYTMTDINNPSNTSSILTPNDGYGQAQGIGFKIFDEEQEIIYGPPESSAATRSFGIMTATGGSIQRNMKVRYVRTQESVTPGKVTGGVTITLSYK